MATNGKTSSNSDGAALLPKSILKKSEPARELQLPEQPDPQGLDLAALSPTSPEIICRQATNIGTIGHVAQYVIKLYRDLNEFELA